MNELNVPELGQNPEKASKIIIAVIMTALVVGGGVYVWQQSQLKSNEKKLQEQITALQEQVNRNDDTISDKNGVETQDEISEKNSDQDVTEQDLLIKTKEDDRFVYYSGAITVSGEYREASLKSIFGGELCFYADENTGYLIPRDSGENNGDTRSPWFCFGNKDEAKTAFGINDKSAFVDDATKCIKGNATVKVSDYKVDKTQGAAFDVANLDNIISKENYTTKCE